MYILYIYIYFMIYNQMFETYVEHTHTHTYIYREIIYIYTCMFLTHVENTCFFITNVKHLFSKNMF